MIESRWLFIVLSPDVAQFKVW